MVVSKRVYEILTRKKVFAASELGQTNLKKHLTTLDLTAMGVGATLGVGVYVLAGQVSKNVAGPGVVISFGIAAVVSMLAGLCYAEFGSRVPKAGSGYIYSYVSVGEFMAFFTGWILILNYGIGAASVMRGLSAYVNSLANNVISDWFLTTMPMNSALFGEYIDLFSFAVVMMFTFALAFGAKESTLINNIFTVVNLCVVVFVIVAGLWWVNFGNWQIPEEDVPEGLGTGGFAPYGVAGIIQGAAICFYGFVGFDVIATAGEEAIDAKKSIPIAVIVSLTIIFLGYFGISSVLTMMLPYYAQNENSPLPHAFEAVEWFVAAYIISFGAIFGLMATLMGSIFPLPRIMYAMAKDGLLYSILGEVSERFQTPMWGTLISGTLTAIIAAFFNLKQLVSMVSIGVLLAYSMVSANVLVCSYEVRPDYVVDSTVRNNNVVQRLFSIKQKHAEPDHISSRISTTLVGVHFIMSIVLGAVLIFLIEDVGNGVWWAILILVLVSIAMVFPIVILSFQPESQIKLSFKVPWKPWLPGISISFNLYLMMELDRGTWIRFAIWLVVGLLIYLTYAIRNSKERFPAIKSTTTKDTTVARMVLTADEVNNVHKIDSEENRM